MTRPDQPTAETIDESMPMTAEARELLLEVSQQMGTPAYVYFLDDSLATLDRLDEAFEGRFGVSFAVKSNPNRRILSELLPRVATLDISSFGEMERAIDAGCDPAQLSFSGPAKRVAELESALDGGCGEFICESAWELEELDRLAAARDTSAAILLRINPATVPKKVGVRMSGRPSQFGIDEEDLDPVLRRLPSLEHIEFRGFHVYSATNSLSEEGLIENFTVMIELFEHFSSAHDLDPQKLIFGSGFGIPYHAGETPLDLTKLAREINPQIDAMRGRGRLANAECILEMGRYIVGPNGYFLTSVLNHKQSRGTEIRLCDGGMHHHIAACGLMGMVIRRNYPMCNLNALDGDPIDQVMLVGPLCTTVDTLAAKISLPRLERGHVVAIGSSGAYGLSISPSAFISHPPPREVLIRGTGSDAELLDISEHGDER